MSTQAHRTLSERESYMIEAALQHGFEPINDEATKFSVTQEQIVSLLQSYRSPDEQTLSDLKINEWVDAQIDANHVEMTDQHGPSPMVEADIAANIARGAALQVVMDKGAFITNLANVVHTQNVRAGWWNDLHSGDDLHGKRNVGELLCLVHSEISEALDGLEAGEDVLYKIQRTILAAIALGMTKRDILLRLHKDLSDAMEGYRKGTMDDKLPHRPTFRVELIDALIRILDILGSEQQDTHPAGEIFVEKFTYNQHRSDHKPANRRLAGGKLF